MAATPTGPALTTERPTCGASEPPAWGRRKGHLSRGGTWRDTPRVRLLPSTGPRSILRSPANRPTASSIGYRVEARGKGAEGVSAILLSFTRQRPCARPRPQVQPAIKGRDSARSVWRARACGGFCRQSPVDDGFAQILLKKSENDLARNSRICPARGVEDAGWPREPMTLVAESDR